MGDLRSEERVPAALPVVLGGGRGVTRDISATGVSFEVESGFPPGTDIQFAVDLEGPTGMLRLNCNGRIVRCEEVGSRIRLAVKIEESSLQRMSPLKVTQAVD